MKKRYYAIRLTRMLDHSIIISSTILIYSLSNKTSFKGFKAEKIIGDQAEWEKRKKYLTEDIITNYPRLRGEIERYSTPIDIPDGINSNSEEFDLYLELYPIEDTIKNFYDKGSYIGYRYFEYYSEEDLLRTIQDFQYLNERNKKSINTAKTRLKRLESERTKYDILEKLLK